MDTRVECDAGDNVVFRVRPSVLFVLLFRPTSLLVVFFGGLSFAGGLRVAGVQAAADKLQDATLLLIIAMLALNVGEWLSRRYVATTSGVTIRAGLLRRLGAEVPLRNVQHFVLTRNPAERLFNLGTIGIATAGADGPAAYLLHVRRPEQLLARLKEATSLARGEGSVPVRQRPRVIGLAGGIGAGKSQVAKLFAERGCLVIDSDTEAKAALDRPSVRGELVKWWGPVVLDSEGRIDRKKLASIIFSDATQRERLERLVHPLVKATRDEMIARADPRRTPAVIVDAPLLYEAGLDRECDAVVFVDAPRPLRLARVLASRGWTEEELEKREKAQIPIEEKRRRADHVIVNSGDLEALRRQAGEVLEQIIAADLRSHRHA